MNLRRVDLNLLTVFDAVFTECNMSRAADKIGMSQPALSLAISRFRHLTGDVLFERSGHGVKPTARAIALAGPVRRALDMVTRALEQGGEFDPRQGSADFNLALGDLGALEVIPKLAAWIERNEASITLNTVPTAGIDVLREMVFGNVHLHLWIVPPGSSDGELASEQVSVDDNVCLVRRDHPLVEETLDLDTFCQLRHVILRNPGSYGPSLLDRQLWSRNLTRKHGVTVHSLLEFPTILQRTDMIATVPSRVARHLARDPQLKIVATPEAVDVRWPIYMIWPSALTSDPGHRWLREFVAGILR